MSSGVSDSGLRLGVLNFGDVNIELPAEHRVRFLDLGHPNNKKCKHCGARLWKEETINCCGKGKFVVPRLKPLPEGVYDVYAGRRSNEGSALTTLHFVLLL